MKIPYLDININQKEQAAGYPPFTRGYQEYSFNPDVITTKKLPNFDYILQNSNPSDIIELFQKILNNNSLKPTFHLFLKLPINSEVIVITRILRTLLSLVCHLKTNTPSASKFCFYLQNIDSHKILNDYQYAQISQTNTLFTSDDESLFLFKSLPLNYFPIDSFYGSKLLEQKTNKLFENTWEKIYSVLN